MTARQGMLDLIERLRGMTDASVDEYTIGAHTWWSDDDLQTELDRQRIDLYREPLQPQYEYSGGSIVYHNYYWAHMDVERAESGSLVWAVELANGSAIGTADYARHYDGQYIRFTANTAGSAYTLTYRAYDVERAAAQIWRRKAAHVSALFDVKTDNHDLKRSQLRQSYMDMAQLYDGQSKPRTIRMVRTDVN